MSKRLSAIFTGLKPTDNEPSPISAGGASGSGSMPGSRRMSAQHSAGPRDRSGSPGPARLSKIGGSPQQTRRGSGSAPRGSVDLPQPSLQELKQDVARHTDFGAPSPLMPPPRLGSPYSSRPPSRDGTGSNPGTPYGSRPTTPNSQLSSPVTPASPGGTKQEKKKGWFGKSKKDKDVDRGPYAWIAGHPQKMPYNHLALQNAQPVSELWDEAEGNCLVYLFSKASDRGPSFRVDSSMFSSSSVLTRLAFSELHNNQLQGHGDRHQPPLDARMHQLSMHDPNRPEVLTPPRSPNSTRYQDDFSSNTFRHSRDRYANFQAPQEAHLYLPLRLGDTVNTPVNGKEATKQSLEHMQTLIDVRNFFAFLCGQSLVATERRSSFFQIFMAISNFLKAYEFSNLDGSTFGEVANTSFDNYVGELGLGDVRGSREKVIESLVLGERMRSVLLYNEAFTHFAGRHDEIMATKSPRLDLISPIAKNRLTRAALDLEKRVASVRLILSSFEFPALFSGIGSSKTSEERKEGVRFDAWRDGFTKMRYFVMTLYKQHYGNWPPKASSKKNDLETSGLNRAVLQNVYFDMCSLYDLLVDKISLTTRTVDGIDLAGDREEATVRALRKLLSEYDRSSPPVKPPVPFDLPKIPTLKTTRPNFGTGDKRLDIKALSKKLKDDEVHSLLRASWNPDAIVTPFVDAFRDMEKKAAHNCTIGEIRDLRIGQWIFMYVVLQALPLLACDAPSLKYTKGCEYFLCEPPRSGVPWANPDGAQLNSSQTWYRLDSGGVVSLPSDVVEHGVEGVYKRSHCWVMADRWAARNPILNAALHDSQQIQQVSGTAVPSAPGATLAQNPFADLPPPPGALGGLPRPGSAGSGTSERSARSAKRISTLGLEPLPLPPGVMPDTPGSIDGGRVKSAKTVDSAKTFDAILSGIESEKKGKKR